MNNIAQVTLSKYNPDWSKIFVIEAEIIRNSIKDHVLVEHIGSTSIPNSIAKPEIDILIGISNLKNAGDYIASLEKIGYLYFPQFEEFVPERRYLRKSKGIVPLLHIHMVEKSSEFWLEHLLFKKHLLAHPELVQEYNKLKQDLVLKSKGDRKTYSKGKEEFIKNILKEIKV